LGKKKKQKSKKAKKQKTKKPKTPKHQNTKITKRTATNEIFKTDFETKFKDFDFGPSSLALLRA
jgi:hypothetical protein